MVSYPSGREGSVTPQHVQMPGWERDKATNRRRAAVGQEVEHQPEDVVRQMADLAAG